MLTCELCGAVILGSYLRTEADEVFCIVHRHLPQCTCCRAPFEDDGESLCRTCRQTAVRTQDDVKRVLPRLRSRLRAMGIRPGAPVHVTLVSAEAMKSLSGDPLGAVTGLTVSQGRHIARLSIVDGLTAVEFGAIVAHESMHAWMAGQGFPATPRIVGEGLCQLASYRLLRDDSSPRARMLRRNIENDLDPVYGDGFRRVRAAVQRHGQAAVLRSVGATGQLPHGGP